VLALRWSVVRSKGPHQTYVTFGWFLAVGQGVGVKFHKLGMAPGGGGWERGVRWAVVFFFFLCWDSVSVVWLAHKCGMTLFEK